MEAQKEALTDLFFSFGQDEDKQGGTEKSQHNDQIFVQLCPETNYLGNNECDVCGKKLRFLVQAKVTWYDFLSSKFCGKNYCKDHCDKKRANPKEKTEFCQICTICDQKYIWKSIYEEYKLEKDAKVVELKSIETQISDTIGSITEKQSELRTLREGIDTALNRQIERINEAKEREFRLKRAMEKIEEENNLLLNQEAKLNFEITSVDEEVKKLEEELKDLFRFLFRNKVNHAIRKSTEEVEKESNRLIEIIERIEEKINQNEINSKSIHTANQMGSVNNHYEFGNIISLLSQNESSLVINENDLKNSIRKFKKRKDDGSEIASGRSDKWCCVFR